MKPEEGTILITNEEPIPPFRKYSITTADVIPNGNDDALTTTQLPQLLSLDDDSPEDVTEPPSTSTPNTIWTFGPNNKTVLYSLQPDEENGWKTTHLSVDNNLAKAVDVHTRCYGFWAVHIDNDGNILSTTCTSAQPTWMNDMRDHIKDFKFANLFIVGSHDSGSFRTNFNPHGHDSIVTKYSLTQVSVYYCSERQHQIKYTIAQRILDFNEQ